MRKWFCGILLLCLGLVAISSCKKERRSAREDIIAGLLPMKDTASAKSLIYYTPYAVWFRAPELVVLLDPLFQFVMADSLPMTIVEKEMWMTSYRKRLCAYYNTHHLGDDLLSPNNKVDTVLNIAERLYKTYKDESTRGVIERNTIFYTFDVCREYGLFSRFLKYCRDEKAKLLAYKECALYDWMLDCMTHIVSDIVRLNYWNSSVAGPIITVLHRQISSIRQDMYHDIFKCYDHEYYEDNGVYLSRAEQLLYDCIEKSINEAVDSVSDFRKEMNDSTLQQYMETANEAKRYLSEMRPIVKQWIEIWGELDSKLARSYIRHDLERIASTILLHWASIASMNKTRSSQTGGNNSVDNAEDGTSEESGHYIEIGTVSDEDQWLEFSPVRLNTEILRRLADAYNASVVMNSIMTDFDLQMRGFFDVDEIVKVVNGIDIAKVRDAEVVAKLKAYRKEMLYLLSANPNEVDQNVHNPWKAKDDLFAYLSKKYNIRTFGHMDEDKYWDEYDNCPSVPEWKSLREKRGDGKLVKVLLEKYGAAKDFDAQCIYAIELAHAYEADMDYWHDDYQNPAIPLMESLMKKGNYSLYLNELWQKWRVLYQDTKGASKDSEIPNWLYNDYRNICCCTILGHIESHPDDMKAINEFLVMACKEDILREGEFSYGNQAVFEKYFLFPELYTK